MQIFQIQIGDQYVQNVDGRQLRLAKTPAKDGKIKFKNRDPFISGLRDLGKALEFHGVIRPWDIQKFDEAEKLIQDRLEQRLAARTRGKLVLAFGRGEFVLSYNPVNSMGSGGDWTLTNPAKTVARLAATKSDEIGYYPNPFSGIWKALERKILARNETVAYRDLAQTVLGLADELTKDLKVVTR